MLFDHGDIAYFEVGSNNYTVKSKPTFKYNNNSIDRMSGTFSYIIQVAMHRYPGSLHFGCLKLAGKKIMRDFLGMLMRIIREDLMRIRTEG